tara:strand:- start:665 stop:1378 length:714 start_codon:yes stop_codon:yes gene_type:complete
MIVTAQQMYDALLDILNKDNTGTVYPEEFETLINAAQLEFIENKYDAAELTQKRIDDLREIVILQETIANTGPNVAGQEIFLLPYDPNAFVITPKNPSGTNNGYMFMLRASFELQYVNNICGYTGTSELLKSKVMTSDRRDEITRDPFNKPKDERLYYQLTGDRMILFTGTQSYGVSTNIDYIRYPRTIQIVNAQVDCELALHARKEIVDIAARKKLEQIQSPRYQTNVVETRNTIT